MRLDLKFSMRNIYINSNLNPIKKLTTSSRSTELKDILPRNISQMITMTIPISTRKCEPLGQFVLVVAFHAGRFFQTDRQARVCGDFLVPLSSSVTNLFWTWGWPGHREVFEYWGVFGMLSLFLY